MIDHAVAGVRSARWPHAGALALAGLALGLPVSAHAAGASSGPVGRAASPTTVHVGTVHIGKIHVHVGALHLRSIRRGALHVGAIHRGAIHLGAAGGAARNVPAGGTAALGSSAAAAGAAAAGSGASGVAQGAAAPGGGAAAPAALSHAPALTGGLGRSARAARTAHAGKRHVSALAIVIAALGALLALACAAWALARRRAFEPHWWLSLRHSIAEAGWRASGTWAEFTDWVRLGH